MMWKDPFVPFNRLVSGAGMPQAVEHDAGKLRVFRISAQLFFPLPLNTAGGVPPCCDPAAEGPVSLKPPQLPAQSSVSPTKYRPGQP